MTDQEPCQTVKCCVGRALKVAIHGTSDGTGSVELSVSPLPS